MGKKELIHSKEYAESLVNSLVDPMVTTDLRGIITSFREGAEEFIGYKNEEAIGRHISLVYKDGKEEAKRIMRLLEKDGKIKNHEMTFVSKDGREIPTLVSISFLRDAEGKITGTLGIAKDISKMKRMEDALREREEFLSGTLNDMLTFVGVLEPTGKLIFANNTPLLAAGIKLEDVVGKMFYDTYWWAYSEEAREVIKENIEACASGKTVVQEIQAQMADSLIWIEFSMHPIYDEKGKVKYLVPEGRDITERKRTENELKETRDFLERILESSTDSIVGTNMDGKITFANSGAEKTFGYGKEEVIGTHIYQYYAGGSEEAKRVGKIIKKEGRLHFGEIDFLRKDRTIVTLSMSYDLLRDNEGRTIGIVAVGKDITEKMKIEKELIQAKESLESLIEGIMDPIATTDKKGIITYINKGMTEILGYEREDIIGKHISMTYSGGMDEARKLMGMLKEKGKFYNYEVQFIKKYGSLLSAILSISLLRDKSGEIIGTIGICKDITERKRLENELKEIKDFLERVIESSIDGITVLDRSGNITFAAKGAEEMLGYDRKTLLGTHISKYYLGGMEEAKKIMGLVRKEGKLRNCETALVVEDGRIVPISVSVSLLRDDKGGITGSLGIYKDITEKKKLEIELKETKDFLENIVENSIDAIVTTDRKGIISFANRGTTDMSGYKLEEMTGTHVSKYYARGIEEARKVDRILREKGRIENHETAITGKDGRLVPISISISLLKGEKGEAIGTLGVFKNITENKRLQKELEKLSITDNLTGLYNQRHFYNELKREIGRAKRFNHPLSLILFYIDEFKHYNDTYGHLGGDKVLCRVGEVVSKCIRGNVDSGYRYGGDEFVIVLPETDKNQAFSLAERVRISLNNTGLGHVTLSMGLVEYRIEYDLETFVRHADKAMYTAKQSGGDRISVYE